MYNERHHAFNLLKYLSDKNIHIRKDCCLRKDMFNYKSDVCKICANFIKNPFHRYISTCPCIQNYGFGSEKKDREYQVKMTWLKIEEILGEIK